MNPMQSFLKSFRNKIVANIQADGDYKDLREDFIRGMEAVRKQRWMLVWIIVSMTILLFLLSLGGIYYFISKEKLEWMITYSTISGLSLAGMISYLSALWRQVTGAEMAIHLAPNLNEKDLMEIINSLLNTVFPKAVKAPVKSGSGRTRSLLKPSQANKDAREQI